MIYIWITTRSNPGDTTVGDFFKNSRFLLYNQLFVSIISCDLWGASVSFRGAL